MSTQTDEAQRTRASVPPWPGAQPFAVIGAGITELVARNDQREPAHQVAMACGEMLRDEAAHRDSDDVRDTTLEK